MFRPMRANIRSCSFKGDFVSSNISIRLSYGVTIVMLKCEILIRFFGNIQLLNAIEMLNLKY